MTVLEELQQPELGTRIRATWKQVKGRSRKQLGDASGLSLGRIDAIEKGKDLKPGDVEALERGLAQLGWTLDATLPGVGSTPTPGQAGEGTPQPSPAAQPAPCGPCEHGHHSACRSSTPDPAGSGAFVCCDGNLIFGRVPWQDAVDIVAEKRRQEEPPVVILDEDVDEDTLVTVLGSTTEVDADLVRAATSFATETPEPVATGLTRPWPDDDIYVITQGQVATAQRCWRKWWLGHYRALASNREDYGGYRATGDRIHRALAAWYVPDPSQRVDPRDALERALVEDWTKLRQQHADADGIPLDQLDDNPAFASLAKKFHDAALLERAMIEGYVEWVAETGADQGLQVLASETPLWADLEVRSEDDRWGTFTRPFRAVGLLDTRVYRESDGVRMFIDHKTVGDLVGPVAAMPMNQQMKHYHLLEFLNSPEGEARCDGALYNMLRRSKRTDRARPPFYDRAEVRHNAHELDSWKRQLSAWALEIFNRIDRLDAGEHHLDVVPPTPVMGSGPNTCRDSCDFFQVCPLFDDGSRVEDALADHFVKIDPLARYGIR